MFTIQIPEATPNTPAPCKAVTDSPRAAQAMSTPKTGERNTKAFHTGQILEARYESRITASRMQRLLAEWLEERARLIGSLIGLTDEQFNCETAPGQWTYRVVAKHVLTLEQDSLRTIASDQAARAARA